MKKSIYLAMLLFSAISIAQEFTSFEEPEAIGGDYIDTGDATVAHDLIDNAGEPFVNFTSTGSELGFTASYAPYDTPGVGLTDGDSVGVTTSTPPGDNPYPDGDQGYKISDVDGNYILEFDIISSTSTGPGYFIDYFISETGYEGDGTVNESGSDRLRIYIRHLEENDEYDIINTTGSDINDLGIEGQWISGYVGLPPFINGPESFQLVIEVRCNAGPEAFFFDNIHFDGILGLGNNTEEIFSVYPNPASNGYVNVTSSTIGDKNISVYDILGKKVIDTIITNERLNVSELTSGVYILKINQDENSITKKLIIK